MKIVLGYDEILKEKNRDSERQMKAVNGQIQSTEIWGNKSGLVNEYLKQNRIKQEGSDIMGTMN